MSVLSLSGMTSYPSPPLVVLGGFRGHIPRIYRDLLLFFWEGVVCLQTSKDYDYGLSILVRLGVVGASAFWYAGLSTIVVASKFSSHERASQMGVVCDGDDLVRFVFRG